MSGISTVAIKDGHEGSRPHFDGTTERLARLGPGTSYFDINRRPDTPSSAPGSTAASEPDMATPGVAGTPAPMGAGVREWERRRKQQENGDTDSPASSVTTASAADQREKARMIDGMTYDDGFVDTTDSSGIPVLNSAAKAERK
ncbi:hypothetical protein EDC01DRAFT_609628 [Geopyxis carbonaria]|nr:hypothetical protein EDC01DRAFT_609628 [Geopyxis carbonaria]